MATHKKRTASVSTRTLNDVPIWSKSTCPGPTAARLWSLNSGGLLHSSSISPSMTYQTSSFHKCHAAERSSLRRFSEKAAAQAGVSNFKSSQEV